MPTTYTAERKQKAAEIARQKAQAAKLERWKRNLEALAKNAELKKKMMEAAK